ncbi:MAG: hypothetical protein Fur005_08100 [Roseiflexaceae bacterium]
MARLLRDVFVWAYAAAIPADVLKRFLNTAFALDLLEADLADPCVWYRGAWVQGTLAGVVRLVAAPPPNAPAATGWVELSKCYVLPDYHGQGVAAALLEAACDLAGHAGFERIWLAVWQENPRAVRFYQRHQFEVVGTTDIMVEDVLFHDLVMQRALYARAV